MPDDTPREAGEEVRRYWRLMLTLGPPVIGTSLVAGYNLITPKPGERLAVTAGVPFCLSLALYAVLYARARNVMLPATVLWIRRFGQGERSRNLQAHLDFAALSSGGVITLADDDLLRKYDGDWRSAAVMGAGFSVMMWMERSPAWILGPLVGALFFWRDRLTYMWRRRRVLTRKSFRRKIERAMRQIRRHVGSESLFLCPDDDVLWRDVITFLATRVDAVVISADERSGSLEWEIGELLGAGRVKPRNIVLLQTSGANDALVQANPVLASAWVLDLPPKLGWWPYTRTGRALSVLVRAAVTGRDRMPAEVEPAGRGITPAETRPRRIAPE